MSAETPHSPTVSLPSVASPTTPGPAAPSPPTTITLRPPGTNGYPSYIPAPLSFLLGKWHVTHSTLPMWRSKRNVAITYTALPPSSPAADTDRLDDLVTYQSLTSAAVSTVRGVDKSAWADRRDTWDWRGRGWLMIASSHWEVLGWGVEAASGVEWAVTYFAKTLFTPAGVDFYARSPGGLGAETVEGIKRALAEVPDEAARRLAGEVFEVRRDDGK